MFKRLTALLLVLLIPACAFAAPGSVTMYVSAPSSDRVHLRAQPSSNSDSLGLYFTGTPLQTGITDTITDWVKVRIGAVEGYMHTDCIAENAPASAAPTWKVANPHSSWVHLRQGPSTETASLGRYDNGMTVKLLGQTKDGWCYIAVDGKKGYMYQTMLSERDDLVVLSTTIAPGGFIPITTTAPTPDRGEVDWSAWDFGSSPAVSTPVVTPVPTPTPIPGETTILGMTAGGDYIHLYVAPNSQYLCFTALEEQPYIFEVDVNFDGVKDIGICTAQGASNAFYEFFVFDDGRYHFVGHPGTDMGIPNFDLHPEQQLVSSRVNNGWAGALHEDCLYRWEGYQLKTIRRAVGEEYTETQLESDRVVTTTWTDQVRIRVYHQSEETGEGTVVYEEVVKNDEMNRDVFERENAVLWQGLR